MSTQQGQNETDEKAELEMENKNHQLELDEEQEKGGHNVEETSDAVTTQYDSDENYGRPNIVIYQCDNIATEDELTGEAEGDTEYQAVKFKDCKKNPGHPGFISVEEFTVKDLPEGHQDKDLYELVKATADLTVKIKVAKTSDNRPEFFPGTRDAYPFYKQKSTRLGSGVMHRVWKFTDGIGYQDDYRHRSQYERCWCENCGGSVSSSNVWWEFDLATATHVVFDDIEADCTSLRLFYDRDDSPEVTIEKVKANIANIKDDWCKLIGVTCDEVLGNKLERKWETYKYVSREVTNKYKTTRDMIKLNFIVSHPHGRYKHVSVGHWTYKKVDDRSHKFSYTTFTCPGSSGASVHCVGYDTIGWKSSDLVHSGSLKSGLNQSGVGTYF